MSSFTIPHQYEDYIGNGLAIIGLALVPFISYFFRIYSELLDCVQMFYVFSYAFLSEEVIFSNKLSWGFLEFMPTFLSRYCDKTQYLCTYGYLISPAACWFGVMIFIFFVLKLGSNNKNAFYYFYNFWKGLNRWFMPPLIYFSTETIITKTKTSNFDNDFLSAVVVTGIYVLMLFAEMIGYKYSHLQTKKWQKWIEFSSNLRLMSIMVIVILFEHYGGIVKYFIYGPLVMYCFIFLIKYQSSYPKCERFFFLVSQAIIFGVFSLHLFKSSYIIVGKVDFLGLILVAVLQIFLFIPKLCFHCKNQQIIYIQPNPGAQPNPGDDSATQIVSEDIIQLNLHIKLINGGQKSLKINQNIKPDQLKQQIYVKLSKQLEINQMSLYYLNKKILPGKKIKNLLNSQVPHFTIVQQKIDLSEVANICFDPERQDAATFQKGVAKMSCGHYVGRDSVVVFLRAQINQQKYQITCPFSVNDRICGKKWQYADCKKIGVFTKSQNRQFEEGLANNWIRLFTKLCPKCRYPISNYGNSSNKIICPGCQTQIADDRDQFYKLIVNAEWNKMFELKNRQTGLKQKCMVPQYRYCTNCPNVYILHKEGCKHMQCNYCSRNFCFVCLSQNTNGQWSCGGSYDYCGKIAPTQQRK